MNKAVLFACSQCFSCHPFEELSAGLQLCKECRRVVKCTCCRSNFHQATKSKTICDKCEAYVEQFGKPRACEYCNIIAAFIGNKCQRCTNCEKKYGPPVTCEQCQQKCAFDRHDDIKIGGKLLCWLCTLSFKRTLAKAKQTGDVRSHNKWLQVESSEHVVETTKLRETIVSLNKIVSAKDAQLLAKDRSITDLRAKSFTIETELRSKINKLEKEYSDKVETLTIKIKKLQKEIATLTKSSGAPKVVKQ